MASETVKVGFSSDLSPIITSCKITGNLFYFVGFGFFICQKWNNNCPTVGFAMDKIRKERTKIGKDVRFPFFSLQNLVLFLCAFVCVHLIFHSYIVFIDLNPQV